MKKIGFFVLGVVLLITWPNVTYCQSKGNFSFEPQYLPSAIWPQNTIWIHEDGQDLPFVVITIDNKTERKIDRVDLNFQFENSAVKNNWHPNQPGLQKEFWKTEYKFKNGHWETYLLICPMALNQKKWMQWKSVEAEITWSNSPIQIQQKGGSVSYADHSVLSNGEWYQIAIAKDGVYKIDKNTFQSLGVDISTIPPQNINVYGNGGAMLSPKNSDFRPDDLLKVPVFFQGEQDGVFNNNDYILFYGQGPDTWSLTQNTAIQKKRWFPSKHCYSDSAYYYIRVDDSQPLRMTIGSEITTNATHDVNQYQDFSFIENELTNLGEMGREFYGESFLSTNTIPYNFPFTQLTGNALLEFGAVIQSAGQASSIQWNVGGVIGTTSATPVGGTSTSNFANPVTQIIAITPTTNNINATFTFQPGNADAQAWMDFVSVNVTRNMVFNNSQMRLRDTTAIGIGNIAEYYLTNATTLSQVWDITNKQFPTIVPFQNNSGTAQWKSEHDLLHEFVVFNNNSVFSPATRGKIQNQDLHAWNDLDLVIVSSPLHLSVAEQIADIHREEGMVVAITTPQQVYHEFSSGNPDVTAIRQLMKMLYDRANGNVDLQPKNLLMLGDGAYDTNRGLEVQKGYNVIIYEADYSLSPLSSYVSDDYFVMLSADDDASSLGSLECGVGRIPAENAEEAAAALKKIKAYISKNTTFANTDNCISQQQSSMGSWRNNLTFVADDQDGSGGPFEQVHLVSADSLSRIVSKNNPEYTIQKIYMDAYTQETTPGGERYPEGEIAIKNRINAGSLIVTYVGHGGERGWAHERILDIPTIQGFDNLYQMPVFLTATCELARYDDPNYKSAGELLVLNPNGGAIAMLTTTRVVFSGENFEMDLSFFNHALNDDIDPELTLGKLNMLTKNGVSAGNDSKPNFSLLGDPALKLNYPKYQVQTTHINDVDLTNFTDTLKALSEVKITGKITNYNGDLLSNFNGIIYPVVYDKETSINTQNNDGGVVQNYKTYNKILFKGKASVSNGDFSFSFPVPYDINYSTGLGRVDYYATTGIEDAHGANQTFKVGGSVQGAQLNTQGPQVRLFMNDSTFVNGGTTHSHPILLALLADENGINTAGNGIGHDITAIIDAKSNQPVVLNSFFESNLDTYKKGSVKYPWSDLSIGSHTLSVKAWDTHNNSSETELSFVVAENETMVIRQLLNYPNPFTTATKFFFEHNQACQDLDITVQVFTVSGKLVKTIFSHQTCTGFRTEGIDWDGKDDFGDPIGKGVYVYRVNVRNPEGKTAEKYEKLVILR
jgi:hypothetical protein